MSKVALVTGASSGIGESIAVHLVESGWTVYAVARRVERMAALESRGIIPFAMDVTDDASMVAGIDRIITEQGQIDALVNNAGYGSYGPVEHVPIDEARRQFEVNVFGLARLTQARDTAHAHPAPRPDRQHLQHRRQDLRAARRVVPRHEVRRRGLQRQPAHRARTLRHRRRHRRARPDHLGVEHHRPREHGRAVGGHRLRGPRAPDGRHVRAGRHPTDEPGPEAVAEKDLKALEAANPAARYPAGRGARAIVTARRLLPDRAMDAVMRRALSG